jgi:uncharacterized protein involved in outer membrane biogenesis
MSVLKKWLIALAVLASVMALLPLVIPYDHYRPRIEAALKARLDTPVKIGNIDFTYSPRPQLVIESLQFGVQDEARVGKVVVPLTWRNVLQFRSVLHDVSLEDARFTQAFALSLPTRLKPNTGGKDVHFASLRLTNVTVVLDQVEVGPFFGELQFNPDGTFHEVLLTDQNERARLTIRPTGAQQFALALTASNWTTPGKYAFRFDELTLGGTATPNGLEIDTANGLLMGSAVIGQGRLTWGETWQLQGTVETKSIDAEQLISLFSPNTRATGRMAATANFNYQAAGLGKLLDAPQIDLAFNIRDGRVHNLDLVAPLKSSNPTTLRRGGQTRFDTLSGKLSFRDDVTRLTDIQLDAGAFKANGALTVDAKQALSGRFGARLRSGGIAVDASLSVAGTLDAPELRSGGAFKPGSDDVTTRVF